MMIDDEHYDNDDNDDYDGDDNDDNYYSVGNYLEIMIIFMARAARCSLRASSDSS